MEKIYQIIKKVFDHIFKHLEVYQKYFSMTENVVKRKSYN